MFEIGIFCFILFAIAYWATLFIMGRRDDVLHGEFVEADPERASASVVPPMDVSVAVSESASAAVPAAIANPIPSAPVIAAEPARVAVARPVRRPAAVTAPVNHDKLQSLLASIKRELKNAAQM